METGAIMVEAFKDVTEYIHIAFNGKQRPEYSLLPDQRSNQKGF